MNRTLTKRFDQLARRGVNLDALLRHATAKPSVVSPAWRVLGVNIPNGSHLRTWHIDRPYWATVVNGQCVMKGKSYETPSAAAGVVFKRPTNGWDVWEIRTPGAKQWRRLRDLRQGRRSSH